MEKPEVQLEGLITNGYPYQSTIEEIEAKGYIVTSVHRAKPFHPYATDTDHIVFYAKPIDTEEYEKWQALQSQSEQLTMNRALGEEVNGTCDNTTEE